VILLSDAKLYKKSGVHLGLLLP